MDSFIPNIKEEDLSRLLNRDYPAEKHQEIIDAFNIVTVKERLRVIAACMKNANGNTNRLISELGNANGYWREIITEAEYPSIKKSGNLTKEEVSDKQKQQYILWLERV